ncbi:DUF397 domain-containing protein [Streptomyces sp. B6B3]|uniref:DUF397 domain-containing protein n=1 Tax=Streptomyces sp. B6B3 TaxID=3153570 RepID=UPI00325D939B
MENGKLGWRRSSFCGGGGNNCVEVAATADQGVLIRESEEPDRIIAADGATFGALISAVKAGRVPLAARGRTGRPSAVRGGR